MFWNRTTQESEQLKAENQALQAFRRAIESSVPFIQFTPEGTVTAVNEQFLAIMGYRREEVMGQHHRTLCLAEEVQSNRYDAFWRDLRSGQEQHGRFARKAKDGRTVWLEASYFPIIEAGRVVGVAKIAADVTARQEAAERAQALLSALDRSLATIEFEPDGRIITANQNFLRCFGYSLSDISGKHHRMLCDDAFYRDNPRFWQELAAGDLKSGLFMRIGRGGQPVWLEATYNPILDHDNKVIKVVKLASDVTARVEEANAAREVSQQAGAVTATTLTAANRGKTLTDQVLATSRDINGTVQQVSAQIEQLNAQSRNIEAIISTISSIADQTNLLALNAAIEAARAGDQGRGFAVVADEVRQLAARTSSSTSEIATVISKNSEITSGITQTVASVSQKAETGQEQANSIASVMEEIIEGAESVSQTIRNLSR
ncbi:MAG: methyl-accepting chemotaxis protein [Aeromonas sp.]